MKETLRVSATPLAHDSRIAAGVVSTRGPAGAAATPEPLAASTASAVHSDSAESNVIWFSQFFSLKNWSISCVLSDIATNCIVCEVILISTIDLDL